jgi:arylsulfatase
LAKEPPEDRFVFSQLNRAGDGLYMALNRRWKFVYSAPDRRQMLFDRLRDPGETTDLGAATWDAKWPTQKVQNEMRAALIAWLQEQGEEAALEDGKLKLYPKREMPSNPDAWLLYQDHAWADQRIPGYTDEI